MIDATTTSSSLLFFITFSAAGKVDGLGMKDVLRTDEKGGAPSFRFMSLACCDSGMMVAIFQEANKE